MWHHWLSALGFVIAVCDADSDANRGGRTDDEVIVATGPTYSFTTHETRPHSGEATAAAFAAVGEKVRIVDDLGTDTTTTYVCADPPCDLEPLPAAIYAPANATTFNYLIYIYRSAAAAKTAEEDATGTNALDGSKVVYRRKANMLVMLAPTKRIIEQVEERSATSRALRS